ncbi:hypothetical protein JX265_005289 [Neoarthrinium moseri]|uniref:C2H2-type domain-containing protein n=1 Tax=Neoarthrinium moseri TaxID=1658444 RepID=A0A9Q0AN63_9PEZI|nr:uncharacterized protein JN550_012531 [Neoarthrinium moseri]KAI1845428.1 hypothetical protein JX266_008523 [Neoarthrinium moseri]KAI1858699.1 hypothetical protein JN550_012531 [Neoarthrinium moseri]KAI1873667.1 hypothetical protein JX265_005289 [Neoarthrinium moseri]
MDLSPPPLSRSPVSSPNTDYPSPDLVDSHYKLTSLYDQNCGMDPNLDSESLPPLDATTSAEWNNPALLHTSTSADIPNILSGDYNTFANYDPALSAPYTTHDIYSSIHAHAPAVSLDSQSLSRTLSHSSDLSSRPSYTTYSHCDSPQPHVKMEGASEYPDPSDVPRYPSPHLGTALPVEVGGYSSAASSSGYLSDAPSSSWPKSEYGPLEPDAFGTGSNMAAPSLIQGRQPYKIRGPHHQRTKQPRRLTTKEEANYQCEVKGCGKLFSRSYNYKAHLETHDENREYPFPCAVSGCSKKFVRKTDLQRHHQSVHMKEKNHRCDFCSRLFARKDTLRRHMEDGCSKRFDIGTLDLRSEGYDTSAYSRPSPNLLAPPTQLPPMASPRPRSSNPNLLEPVSALMRRDY